MRARFYFSVSASLLFGCALEAQIVSYTFGTTGSPTISPATSANVSASDFASNLGTGASSSSSPGSATAGGGGGLYFVASNWRSADNNYFYFTITPATGYQIQLSDFSFYYAATGSGPTSASLTSSADSYGNSLASFSLTRQAGGGLVASDWHPASSSITLSAITTATTFRLNATGASGSTGSLRVDAVTLNGIVSAVPEPATVAVIVGGAALIATAYIRRRKKSPASSAEDFSA